MSPTPAQRQAASPEKVPERKVFLSRKTSFPIYGPDVADSWLQLLNLLLRIGSEKRSEAGEVFAEALNPVVTVGLPVIAEDLEVAELPESEDFPPYFDICRADFERYFQHLEPVGKRLEGIRDAQAATQALTEAEIPDLLSARFDVVEGTLYGSFVLGSADVYSDWPLVATALVRLQRQAAQALGVEPGAATFVVHAARLFARDWARAERKLSEAFKRPLPLQVDHSGVFLFGNDGGRARGMLLDHDAGTIFWEDAFDDAQELSWYIVDAMPWLLPQHIRYVGQECSSLMNAMQKCECYEQG